MSEGKTPVGKIRTEVHGRLFKIIIDNAAKKNSFRPQMMAQMSDALTILHTTEAYWVGVVCAEGNDFTAGLDMPKFSVRTPRSGISSKAISMSSGSQTGVASRLSPRFKKPCSPSESR